MFLADFVIYVHTMSRLFMFVCVSSIMYYIYVITHIIPFKVASWCSEL